MPAYIQLHTSIVALNWCAGFRALKVEFKELKVVAGCANKTCLTKIEDIVIPG